MGKYDSFMAATEPAAATPDDRFRAAGVDVPKKYAGFMAATESQAPAAAPAPEAQPEPSFLQQVAQPFKDIGNGLLAANDFAARAIAHPIDTFQNPGATFREGMRGINSNIPFANSAVEAMGGPPAESPADAAAAPGANAFGGALGAATVGGKVAGIAAKGVEAVAPVVGRAISGIGEAAQGRQVNRALEDLEMKTYKRTRAGVRTDVVADAVAENPELRKAAGNDAKLAKAVDEMKQKAVDEIDHHYSGYKVTLGDSIDNFNTRIKALRAAGTSTDAAVADHLETIRDEMIPRLGQRESVSVKHLRAEQTDFQKKGYGKALPGDEAGSARIEANREASKAVGDAVVKRVTGMPYAEAKVAAEADQNGIAARLFKANDQINAANKIEASITDRASRVQPKEGLTGKLIEIGKEIRHSPMGYGLSLAPRAVAGGLNMADNALARIASPAPAALGGAVARAATASPQGLGQLVEMARAGLRGSELTAMAQQMGIPTARAQAFADTVAESDARQKGRQ